MADLVLDDKHHYFFKGHRVPGVSEVLEAVGLKPKYEGDRWYSERGTAVHAGIKLAIEGRLNWATVDTRIAGYIKAAKKFMSEFTVQPLEIEQQLYHEVYGYAGTIDLLADIHEQSMGVCVIDWKTGDWQEWMEYQLAAYDVLLPVPAPRRTRATVHLKKDGNFSLHICRNPKAVMVFNAALTVFHERIKMYGWPKEEE